MDAPLRKLVVDTAADVANAKVSDGTVRQEARTDDLMQMRPATLNLLEDAAEARTQQEAAMRELRAQIERREKADAALGEVEARLQLVIDSSGDGIWDWDVLTMQGRFSGRWKEMLGYGAEEPDQTFCDIRATTHPHDFAVLQAALSACLAGESRTLEFEQRKLCKDGSWKWVLTRGSVVARDADGKPLRLLGTNTDIDNRKATEARLQLAGSVFSHAREGMLITDKAGSILDVNESFTRDTGYGPGEVLGRNPRLLQSGRHDADFFAALWQALAQNRYWYGEIWNRRRSGEVYASMLTIVAVCDAAGAVQSYLGMFTDMTPFKEHQKQLERIAHYDAVTGLPNRILLESLAGQDIALARRGDTSLALMMVSIDRLKQINATLGHVVGDQLLVAFGQRMQAVLPTQATLARVAGEGFVLVLPGHDSEAAARLAVQLLAQVAEPYRIDAQEVTVTASMGIAMFPDDGQDFEQLATCVAGAMHRAQAAGRNTYQFFDARMQRAEQEHLELASALRMALEHDTLELHYQPLADLQGGGVSGMEALLRWQHPTLGAVTPARFIPVAENSGLIKQVGNWVLRRACRDMRSWLDLGVAVPPVAINLSPVQFRDDALVQQVEQILAEFRIDPSLFYFEITEGSLMEDVGKSQTVLRAFKALGVQLSLDDFGTGYSSLSYLKLFPFDKVKIDQSFVSNITTVNEDAVIAKVVVSMAHGLGLRVTAEGVETEAQCAFLRDNMCDEVQGYLLARAMPAPEMLALLQRDWKLASHLLRQQVRSRTLLLVDDESNVIASLKRLLRADGYRILTAGSGQEGLDVLAQNPVDIIVSDQRMPGMTGVEFLRNAYRHYPDTLRIVLSGYTELHSVTQAINEGAVYRFLTKPWDDEQLRRFISDAFVHKELADENRQLDLKVRTANQDLAASNRKLQEVIRDKQQQIARNEYSLHVIRDTVHNLPLPVIGLDEDNMVALANAAAIKLFGVRGSLLGEAAADVLADVTEVVARIPAGARARILINRVSHQVEWHAMGQHSSAGGKLITLAQEALPT